MININNLKRYSNSEYYISNDGKVYSNKNFKLNELKEFKNKSGYCLVMLYIKQKRCSKLVHRLVAECYLDNFDSLKQINHIDGNKSNNGISNLEVCTCKGNINHYLKSINKKPFNIKISNVKDKNFEPIIVKTYREAQLVIGYKQRSSISSLLNNKYSNKNGYVLEKIYIL